MLFRSDAFGRRNKVADAAWVEKVTVAVPLPVLIVTGFVLPNEQLACAGVKVTVAVTAQESVTVPVVEAPSARSVAVPLPAAGAVVANVVMTLGVSTL